MFNRLLGGLGRVLIFSGVVLLLFVGFQLWGTTLYESSEQDALADTLAREVLGDDADADPSTVDISAQLAKVDPSTVDPEPAPPEGEPGGFLRIPRIGLEDRMFVEGVSKADLRKGPGHYPGTPMPGQPGNAAIAGHRTTYGAPFNRIDELVPGDRIEVFTRQGRFVYEVVPVEPPPEGRAYVEQGAGWFSVRPADSWVIGPSEENLLTLTACHPKYSARQRIIVRAKLVSDAAPPAPADTAAAPGRSDAGGAGDAGADALIAGDPDEKAPAIAWGAGFLALWGAMWGFSARTIRRGGGRWWPAFAAGVPASAVLLWVCFTHLDRFLPSY